MGYGLAEGDIVGQQEVAAVREVELHQVGVVVAGFAAAMDVHHLGFEAFVEPPAGSLTEAKQVPGEYGFEQAGAEHEAGGFEPAPVVVGVEGQVVVQAVVFPLAGFGHGQRGVFAAHLGSVQGVAAPAEVQGIGRREPPALERDGAIAHTPHTGAPVYHAVLHEGGAVVYRLAAVAVGMVMEQVVVHAGAFAHAGAEARDVAREKGYGREAEGEGAEWVGHGESGAG